MDQIRDPQDRVSSEHTVRVEKVAALRALGFEPWPDKQEVTAHCASVITEFTDESTKQYAIAGRLMNVRLHGRAAFAHMQDSSGKLQVYIREDVVGEDQFKLFEHSIDVGDIVWFFGTPFKTKVGEITLRVARLMLLSKCLHPLPEKFHGIVDIETKYRQRYLDLIMDAGTRDRFMKRSHIITALRSFLDSHGYLEVETPMLHPIAGGAAARPFVTHHNALNQDLYLRIAPELYLKRLIIGGFDRVYEINRNFRNEGVSTRHNPEFTMLELYTAYQDYEYAMNFTESLLRHAALYALGTLQVPYGDVILNFEAPFKRLRMIDAIIQYGSLNEQDISPEVIDTILHKHGLNHAKKETYGNKVLALFEALVEPHLIQPTFIIDFPIETSPLAKRSTQNPAIAPRFELFVAKMELSNAYNELNEPFEQAERFKEQIVAHEGGNDEAHQYDADYILALEYALPPTVGIGIGIDRLVMLLTNTITIKEVILFPTLKKK